MSPNRHEHSIGPGYALQEYLAPEAAASAGRIAAEEILDELQQRLQAVEQELGLMHAQLREVEQQARTAVESEDADRVATTWNEKHRLLTRISELQQQHSGATRQLQDEIQRSLTATREERAEIKRQRAQEDTAWNQLLAAAQQLHDSLRHANDVRAGLNSREHALFERLERLASREFAVLDQLDTASEVTIRRRDARRSRSSTPHSVQAPGEGMRKWALYDPDAGKLVTSLPELLRLLARWYPGLRSEQERVQEFLTLPNAEPLPDTLRRELREAGYLEAEA